MIDFLSSVFDLVVSFLDLPFLTFWFFPLIALAFLASVPGIIRVLTTWR